MDFLFDPKKVTMLIVLVIGLVGVEKRKNHTAGLRTLVGVAHPYSSTFYRLSISTSFIPSISEMI